MRSRRRVSEIAKTRTKTNGPPPHGGQDPGRDDGALAQAIRRFSRRSTRHRVFSRARRRPDPPRRALRVVVCDLMMPDHRHEMHAELVRIAPAQAEDVVFLTGGAFTAAAREFLDQVHNRRLEKPFDLRELRRLVNELIH